MGVNDLNRVMGVNVYILNIIRQLTNKELYVH